MTQHLSKNGNTLTHLLFAVLLFSYAGLGWWLLWHIPYSFPFGGPDELMHLSMAD